MNKALSHFTEHASASSQFANDVHEYSGECPTSLIIEAHAGNLSNFPYTASLQKTRFQSNVVPHTPTRRYESFGKKIKKKLKALNKMGR